MPGQPLIPDLSLIRDYTPEDERNAPYNPTGVTHFQKGEKNLYYINASHEGKGFENPTFKPIEQSIKDYNPQLVIIEGFPSSLGESPARHTAYVKDEAAKNFVGAGEPTYAAYLANQNSIPYRGGEPDDAAVFATLTGKDKNYSEKDLMAFYVLRRIGQARRQEKLDDHNFPQWAEKYLGRGFDFIPAEKRLTFAEFQQWYDTHKREDKPAYEINENDWAPFSTPDANYFQRLSADVGRVREENINTIIANSLNDYDRVLVVYGGAHLTMSRAVYENMLGPGLFRQLAPLPKRGIPPAVRAQVDSLGVTLRGETSNLIAPVTTVSAAVRQR